MYAGTGCLFLVFHKVLCKGDEFFGAAVQISAFLPYESDFLCDCRRDRDPLDSVHIFEKRGVEDSSAQIFLDKSLNGVKLAGI